MATGNMQKKGKAPSALYHTLSIFFLCLGVAGAILMAAAVPEVSFSPAALIVVTVAVISALYISHLFSKTLFYAVLSALAVFCFFYILSDKTAFAQQWQFIFGGIIPESQINEAAFSIEKAALIFAVFFAILIFFFDIMLKLHAASFFLTTAIILLPTIFGYSFPDYAIIFTVIYQLAFFVLPVSFNRNITKSERMQQRIRLKTTFFSVILLLAALLAALPIALAAKEKTFDNVTRVENSILSKLGLSPFSLLYNDEGNINRGDNETNGIITLKLSADKKPSKVIYMRGYFGGNYYGDYWDAPTDNVIFDALASSSDITDNSAELSSIYNSLRFLTTTENYGNDEKAISLNVRNLNINRSIIFTPYNASSADLIKGSSYSFKLYEENDLNMAISDNDSEKLISYRNLFKDYYADAYDNYTYITAESIPLLKELVKEHPLDSIEEISSFIIKTLDEHADYTLTPGTAPSGADTVDYFLFEKHLGYCQQFASSAVLMYRLYGIPARYATGFKVKSEDFEQNKSTGAYEAHISDERAHAWPEILIPEYGWVPVEVTPSSERGFSWSDIAADSQMEETGFEPSTPAAGASPSTSSEKPESEDREEAPDNEDKANTTDSAHGSSTGNKKDNSTNAAPRSVLPWLIPLLSIAAAIGIYAILRRNKISPDNQSFEKIYKKLKLLLKAADNPVTCKLYDKEFPMSLKKAIPPLSQDEAFEAYNIILKALYGRRGINKSEEKRFLEIYNKCLTYVLNNSSVTKRAVLKYIRNLG